MHRLADLGDGLQVRHARLRGGAEQLRMRRCLEAALAGGAADIGLPARALLILPRLAPGVPLLMDRGAVCGSFQRSVRSELQQGVRGALRPWLNPGADAGRAVLFADQVELAACVVRDWLQGTLGARWWAPAVLGRLSPREWCRRVLLGRGDLLPSVFEQLGTAGVATTWVASLDGQALAAATAAIAAAHGLDYGGLSIAADRGLDRGDSSPAGVGQGLDQARVQAGSSGVAEGLQLLRLIPEIVPVSDSPARVRLLALALGLVRAPVWTRGAGLGRALGACLRLAENPAEDWRGDAQTQYVPSNGSGIPSGSIRVRESEFTVPMAPTRGPVREPSPWPPPAIPGARGMVADAPAASALRSDDACTDPSMTRDAETDCEGQHRQRAHVEGQVGSAAVVNRSSAARDPAVVGPSSPPSARRLRAGMPSNQTGPAIGSTAFRSEHTDRPSGQVRTGLTPPASGTVLRSEALTVNAETRFGGLLYLLNLALALGLYGDFTQPRRPGITLSPWDWLALVGRAWLGRALLRDPLWALLARLAVRPTGQRPGADFTPPGDWLMPADWPSPWGAAGSIAVPIAVEVRHGRLRLRHPAGFLLADLPQDRRLGQVGQARAVLTQWPELSRAALGHLPFGFASDGDRSAPPKPHDRTASGPGRSRWMPSRPERGWNRAAQRTRQRRRTAVDRQRALPTRPARRAAADAGRGTRWLPALPRWLGWLLPYLEARLALALGVDDPATVPLLVCRHRARVEVSSTALDIHLSLAELPIALRVAGLDRDPGWLPAAGRSIAFHFQ